MKLKVRVILLIVVALCGLSILASYLFKTIVQSSIFQQSNDLDGLYTKSRDNNSNSYSHEISTEMEKENTFKLWDMIAKNSTKDMGGNSEMHVIVVHHSHTDPGWYWTMEEYYNMRTKHILDNLVKKLDVYRNMTFVWAETVFLAKWWETQNTETRTKFMNIIERKQLEIVSGGWVLPDEATSHYFSLIDQFSDGHHWLKSNLGLIPKNAWSIDPFGYSTTLAYLRMATGFKNTVIDRVDTSIKKLLWEKKMLEFNWRQLWDNSGTSDIVTHVMPYFSYTTMHSCGPDFDFCATLDFKDRSLPKSSIANTARLLVEQVRKKSLLFRYDTVFMAVGGDFRFQSAHEWDSSYSSFSQLIDFINSKKEWNVHIRFGTLNDYFSQIRIMSDRQNKSLEGNLPVIQGDFLPYRDKNKDYWTGYFTSRPYHKRLSRQVQECLRAANMIISLLLKDLHKSDQNALKNVYDLLQRASRNASLFQHHDAITGTSSTANMLDYERRLSDALLSSKIVLKYSVEYLLQRGRKSDTKPVITLSNSTSIVDFGTVVVTNASPKKRSEIVSYRLNSDNIVLANAAGQSLVCQITPFDKRIHSGSSGYVVDFHTDVRPFGVSVYTVAEASKSQSSVCKHSHIEEISSQKSIIIENEYLKINLSSANLLELCLKDFSDFCVKIQTSWHFYVPQPGTGAYLLRDLYEEVNRNSNPPKILLVKGNLFSEIQLNYQIVKQHFRLYHNQGLRARALEMWNIYDISKGRDTELILKLQTSINNENREFHTDSNGFQLMHRKFRVEVPIPANFYPMTSMMMIDDANKRLTLHSRQSHSVSSMEQGSIDVLLDRKTKNADSKGMGQGITDNRETTSKFILQFEDHNEVDSNLENAFPSFVAMLTNDFLQNPLHVFHIDMTSRNISTDVGFVSNELPCVIEIANMRMVSDTDNNSVISGIGITFHKRGIASKFSRPKLDLQCAQHADSFRIGRLFPNMEPFSVYKTTLTYLEIIEEIDVDKPIIIKPMEMVSFYIRLNRL